MGAALLAGCRPPRVDVAVPTAVPVVELSPAAPTGFPGTATPEAAAVAMDTPAATTPTPTLSPTPFYAGPLSPPCGLSLPAVPPASPGPSASLPDGSVAARAAVRELAPESARPALDRLFASPGTVGLVAYQIGRESEGAFWNADAPMPLASVVKLIDLVAYAEAVSAGTLDPLERVPLSELERYYLPNFDLGAHRRALSELRAEGRVLEGDEPAVVLGDVAEMMVRFSSNAASDYLHARLGQQVIEDTATSLGMTGQSAPCSFLGQFLIMANHTRRAGNDAAAVRAYASDPAAYGADVALLTDAYSNDAGFRRAETAWRETNRRPSIDTQRLFSETLNAQGTARDYAALMARLAQNGLSMPDSSYLARRVVEWPMRFPANQELFSNLGYKNGALPGVLTTAYYAYRWDGTPVVVALFYRDLPQQTYRDWRFSLAHDELARWLLSDPAAIPALAAALAP